jgi:FkbM family methyltransferase
MSSVLALWRRRPPSDASAADVTLRVRIRALHGAALTFRAGLDDPNMLYDVFWLRFHLPPAHILVPPVRQIWDLGCNIGATSAHFACVYPEAQILAVELDTATAEQARVNTAPWRDRVTVIHGAFSATAGHRRYALDPNSQRHRLVAHDATTDDTGESPAVTGRDLQTSAPGVIDYVKVDIEGAEREVLSQATEWTQAVRCIKVEVHQPYTVDDCVRDLQRLGFATAIDAYHWATVVGWRGATQRR